MNTKHDLLEFWEWQKINIEAHLENGYVDHAIMVIGLIEEVVIKSQKTDIRKQILNEIESLNKSISTKMSEDFNRPKASIQ